MRSAQLELWRVGSVTCEWVGDWRRIRIVSAGETLSDQELASPSEALAAARELRRFFTLISGSGGSDPAGTQPSAETTAAH